MHIQRIGARGRLIVLLIIKIVVSLCLLLPSHALSFEGPLWNKSQFPLFRAVDAPYLEMAAIEEGLPAGRDEIMEGGIRLDEALLWARERDVSSILEFAISLETNAYDLYLKMERKLEGDAKRVFLLLSDDEKRHLDRLAALLEKKV